MCYDEHPSNVDDLQLKRKEPSVMIRVLSVLLLLLPVTLFAFQNEPAGFRNSAWDTPVNKIAGLKPAGEATGTVRRYLKMDETMLHEGVTLADILYVADQGKLVGAELTYDCTQRDALAETLNRKYGAASVTAFKGKTLTWRGKITTVVLGPPAAAQAEKPAPDAEPPLCKLTYEATRYHAKNALQQKTK